MSAREEQIVHIVDDDDAFRDSLAWLVESSGHRTKGFASAEAFLEACHPGMSGCLIADIRMAGISGIELHERLAERGVTLPTIIVTGHGELPLAVEAFRGGVADFIEKPLDDAYVLQRIDHCLMQDRRNAERRSREKGFQQLYETLTAREREVFEHVVEGRLNKQIADLMGISIKTVEVHRGRVMEKMKVRSVAELVRRRLAEADDT